MNPNEPTLLDHINQLREKLYVEGIGLTNIIFAGKLRSDADLPEGLLVHRKAVEEEVNSSDEEVHVTGLLMGQVFNAPYFYIHVYCSLHNRLPVDISINKRKCLLDLNEI